MVYTLSLMTTGSGIQKSLGWDRHTHTHTDQGDLTSLLLFFQKQKSKLKIQRLLLTSRDKVIHSFMQVPQLVLTFLDRQIRQ
jgi:hypothetical protein